MYPIIYGQKCLLRSDVFLIVRSRVIDTSCSSKTSTVPYLNSTGLLTIMFQLSTRDDSSNYSPSWNHPWTRLYTSNFQERNTGLKVRDQRLRFCKRLSGPSNYTNPMLLKKMSHSLRLFLGVTTTEPLLHFYETVLKENKDSKPPPPSFELVVASSASMGSKGGIIVDQKRIPSQLGRLKFAQSRQNAWNIRTSNIRRFHFDGTRSKIPPDFLLIDGNDIPLTPTNQTVHLAFLRSPDGSWKVIFNLERMLSFTAEISNQICGDQTWRCISERHGAQLGNKACICLSSFCVFMQSTSLASGSNLSCSIIETAPISYEGNTDPGHS